MGPITSSFGQREDPILGNGEGEFHAGIDISAPNGVPIRATGDGTVQEAEMSNGYGREVVIDHGHGVETVYGHMSGFAVIAGQTVVRGQVIGYVGHSGRTTGSHLHYEVRIRNTPVNPHKYLRTTLADLGSETPETAPTHQSSLAHYPGSNFQLARNLGAAGRSRSALPLFCVWAALYLLCGAAAASISMPEVVSNPAENKDFPVTFVHLFGHIPSTFRPI